MRSIVALLFFCAIGWAADDPFVVGLRKAVMGGGYVLQVQNNSPASVRFTVTALGKTATQVLDSKKVWELGHLEGFKFADRDTAVVSGGGITRKFQIKGDQIQYVPETAEDRQAWVVHALRSTFFPAEVQLQASGRIDMNLDNVGEYGSVPQLILGGFIDRGVMIGVMKLDYTLASYQPISATAWAVTDPGAAADDAGTSLRSQGYAIAAIPKDHAQPVLVLSPDGQVRSKVLPDGDVLKAAPVKDGQLDLSAWTVVPK